MCDLVHGCNNRRQVGASADIQRELRAIGPHANGARYHRRAVEIGGLEGARLEAAGLEGVGGDRRSHE